jgi:glutamyl/glutaminyl-tRNA synthetase
MEILVAPDDPFPLGSLVFFHAQRGTRIKLTRTATPEPTLKGADTEIKGELAIANHLSSTLNLSIYPEALRPQIDIIVSTYPRFNPRNLDQYLTYRTYLAGFELTLADLAVFTAIPNPPKDLARLNRWHDLISTDPTVKRFLNAATAKPPAASPEKKKPPPKASAKIVTRFAPEPSGFLHIGHAKAALASESLARTVPDGTFVLRFDDTNPVNETSDFEERILADTQLLELKPDRVEHTSDFIPKILEIVKEMIGKGFAYIDDTPTDEMKALRKSRQPSARRDAPVSESLRLWDAMVAGTDVGLKCAARAKIDFLADNGCLRDPVIARCVNAVHHRLPDVKVFPTYDLACPIVDSLAGITHAMRSWEYTARNEQYSWFVEKLALRKIEILSFSRLSFAFTLLGKRHLRALIAAGSASGWDDPRFPTVRGLRRRGLSPAALRTFTEEQGASCNANVHGWDKLWATNRDVVAKSCPRVMSIAPEEKVVLTIAGAPGGVAQAPVLQTDPKRGFRELPTAGVVWIASDDLLLMKPGMKVTLLHWGNVIVDEMTPDGVTATWTVDREFRGTPKINWIVPDNAVKIVMREWNHLLTVPIAPEGAALEEIVNPVAFVDTEILCDRSIAGAPKGSIWQLERRAEVIIDEPETETTPAIGFLIPSGRQKPIGLPIKVQLFKEVPVDAVPQ